MWYEGYSCTMTNFKAAQFFSILRATIPGSYHIYGCIMYTKNIFLRARAGVRVMCEKKRKGCFAMAKGKGHTSPILGGYAKKGLRKLWAIKRYNGKVSRADHSKQGMEQRESNKLSAATLGYLPNWRRLNLPKVCWRCVKICDAEEYFAFT